MYIFKSHYIKHTHLEIWIPCSNLKNIFIHVHPMRGLSAALVITKATLKPSLPGYQRAI